MDTKNYYCMVYGEDMSQIISFSADEDFLNGLDGLIAKSGYQNRSRFLRDAALFFSEIKQALHFRKKIEENFNCQSLFLNKNYEFDFFKK